MNWTHISYFRYLVLVLCSCFLVGCGTKKMTSRSNAPALGTSTDNASALLSELEERGENWSAIRGSFGASIKGGGKSVFSRVNFTAIKGQGIKLSIVPLVFVEAARLWFSTDGVTLVDLINGRYAQESYEALSERLGFPVNYDQIESIFLGQVFVPEEGRSPKALERLGISRQDDGTIRLEGQARSYPYLFVVNEEALLDRFDVFGKDGRGLRFRASYGKYVSSQDERAFPSETAFVLFRPNSQGAQEIGSLRLDWSRLSSANPESLQVTPVIKDKYERIDFGQILKLLDKLDE